MPTELQGHDNPTIAFNLNGVSDYSTQMPFLDIMRMARPFQAEGDTYSDRMTYEELVEGGYLDENGYPTSIPEDMNFVGTIWDWGASTDGNTGVLDSRAGTYVVQWEGEGTLNVGGVINVLSQEDGQIIFENPTGAAFWLYMEETDPNGTGDNLTNISVVREDHLEMWEAGAIFNPDWTSLIDDTRQFRFMDWMDTNNSPITDFEQLNTMDSATWVGHGMVPVEVMVRLANETGVDPWFTLPLGATDDFVRQFASYVQENLDEGLVATYELSNEPWNYLFQQTHTLYAQAVEDWGLTMYGFGDHYSAYGRASVEMALSLQEVYGTDNDTYRTTLGVQSGGDFEAVERVMTAPSWLEADPENYIAPHTLFDSVSATTYFGVGVLTDDTQRAELAARLAVSFEEAASWLVELMQDPTYDGSIPSTLANARLIDQWADVYGLDLTIYEGGQHLHHLAGISDEARAFAAFMGEFVRTDEMADLYQQLWDGWAEFGDGPQMQFADVSGSGDYGSWGVLTGLYDETARATLLAELNAASEATWEDRGGEHFQQGVTLLGDDGADTLEGSQAEDYLLGSAGDDVLTGYGDDDGIHGGEGTNDRAVYTGQVSDYNVTYEVRNGVGGVVVEDTRSGDNDGTDWVVAVEHLDFANGTVDLLTLFPDLLETAPTPVEIPDAPVEYDPPIDGEDPETPEIPVSVTPTIGDDQLELFGGGGVIDALAGNDTVYGSNGADVIVGGEGVDLLFGADGADTFEGGAGNDMIFGTNDGGPEDGDQDVALYSGSFADFSFSFHDFGEGLILSVSSEAEGDDMLFGMDLVRFADLQANVDDIIQALRDGTSVEEVFEALPPAVSDLIATDGDDLFELGNTATYIDGLGGHDLIYGGSAGDHLRGGDGNDQLFGGDGADTLEGGAGNNILFGAGHDDHVDGAEDVALFSGNALSFEFKVIELDKGPTLIVDSDTGGTFLFGIETVRFDDVEASVADLIQTLMDGGTAAEAFGLSVPEPQASSIASVEATELADTPAEDDEFVFADLPAEQEVEPLVVPAPVPSESLPAGGAPIDVDLDVTIDGVTNVETFDFV
ncbi:MAG: hypothetical protein JXR13_11605 [Thalassovita sp.]